MPAGGRHPALRSADVIAHDRRHEESAIEYAEVHGTAGTNHPGSRGGSDVLRLGVAGALAASLPVTGVTLWARSAPADGSDRFAATAVAVLGLLVAVPVLAIGLRATRGAWPGQPKAALAAVFGLDAAAMLALSWLMPFRWGLLSCLLYAAPALLISAAALLRSRRTVVTAAAGLAVLFAVAVPIRGLQQHVAARAWQATTGVPTRSVAQVVHFPGMRQDLYVWDGEALTAMFSAPLGPSDAWLAAESVRPGYADPCGPVLTAEGDASGTQTPRCVRQAPGLWFRGSADDPVGYVLQRSGVTVTVSGGVWPSSGPAAADAAARRAALRRVVLAAHTASDRELWTRARPAHATVLTALLL